MRNSTACCQSPSHQTRPLNASASAHQNTVHKADSRSVGSCASRWNTNMSNNSKTAVPAQKATHSQGGTSKGGTDAELAALAANKSTANSPGENPAVSGRFRRHGLCNHRPCRPFQQPPRLRRLRPNSHEHLQPLGEAAALR